MPQGNKKQGITNWSWQPGSKRICVKADKL